MEGSSHKPHCFGKPRLLQIFGILMILPVLAMSQDIFSPRSHYEEMSCLPLPNENNVEAYKCAFESLTPGDKRCIYRGAFINDGQSIPSVNCYVGCTCVTRSSKSSGDFVCAIVDCYEYFFPKNQSCIYQYSLNGCCSTKQVCDKTAISKLFECEVDGKIYREGERFSPENSCKRCVCQKGFLGQYVEPFCKNIDCGIERSNYGLILSRCAPVYYEGQPCCPIDWECYKSTDEVVTSGGYASSYQCTYGQLKLNIGDQIVTRNKCKSCSCDYPPLVTCRQKRNCVP